MIFLEKNTNNYIEILELKAVILFKITIIL